MRITRREFCQSAATITLALGAVVSLAPFVPTALAADAVVIPMAELMKPDKLPDMVLGSDKAPVTMIEYASLGCSHCAHFNEATFPEIKKRYIDTGKVRYILREFPLDSVAAAATMVARCVADGDSAKYFAMADTFFRQQQFWWVQVPMPPLLAIAKQAGLTQQSFDACLANQPVLDGIESVRNRAAKEFKVDSTPTFFINGTMYKGALEVDAMSKLIDAQIKG